MGKQAVDTIRNPWVALIAALLIALGSRQIAPGTTWGQVFQPEQVMPNLGLIGGLLITLFARRPGEPPETRVEKAIRDLKRDATADNARRERARRPPPHLPLVLLALVSLTACASTGAPPRDRAEAALEISAASYEATMIEAGRLSVTCLRGTLPDCPRVLPAEKLAAVVSIGERVHDALELGRSALRAWVLTGAPSDETLWSERWRAYRDLLDQLMATAASFGVRGVR